MNSLVYFRITEFVYYSGSWSRHNREMIGILHLSFAAKSEEISWEDYIISYCIVSIEKTMARISVPVVQNTPLWRWSFWRLTLIDTINEQCDIALVKCNLQFGKLIAVFLISVNITHILWSYNRFHAPIKIQFPSLMPMLRWKAEEKKKWLEAKPKWQIFLILNGACVEMAARV